MTRDPDSGLNAGKAKPLYDMLVSFADVSSRDTGQGYPYRETLATCLDCSKQTVDRAADYLENEIGLVKVHRRKVEGRPEENDANLYEIFDAWLIHGVPPPARTPPQLVARYGYTVPGLDVDAWITEHAPHFDLAAWRSAHDERQQGQAAKREEQRRKERARRKKPKPKPKPEAGAQEGGGVMGDATPRETEPQGGSVMGDATPGVMGDATGGVMGDALSRAVVPEPSSTTDPAPAARSAGDARRATAGSSAHEHAEGGCAASGNESSSESAAAAQAGVDVPEQRDQGPELSGEQVSVVKTVVASLPAELVALLPYRSLPRRNHAQVLEAMSGRTVQQVIDRAARRWTAHGYADALHSIDGKGIGSAVGVAVALVQAGECPYARCEDGTDIDTGAGCRMCEERRAERREAKAAATAAGRSTGSVRPAPHRPGWWICTVCEDPGKGTPPRDGECASCRADAAAAAAAGQQLAQQLEQEAAARAADAEQGAAFVLELDEQAAYTEAAERADQDRAERERAARKQVEAEETARIRAEIAAQYPDLAAVSGSVREAQEAQQAVPAPF
ncbi:hypothetical protein [Streptomyces sp. CA-256286]|uniref:hypothetical protein n=1 Tax=Streptomyces sp. CA-256286 TaxID=2801033 RepID=UPI001A9916FF|nr:hypothetical protein [Streptomyces sp. CA-256286]